MRSGLLAILCAAPVLAQVTLEVSSQSLVLSTSESRTIKVAAPGGPVAYTVANKPDWLTIGSGNNFKTPDTLYVQLANSICGTCVAELRLEPAGGAPVVVTVRYQPETIAGLLQLAVSPPRVNLNSTQARTALVRAPRDASVPYQVKSVPAWLSTTSANHFTTPDTLYFQLVNSNCGTCSGTVELLAEGATTPTLVPVTYGISAGASYTVSTNKVTLTYPAPPGVKCGPGYWSRCGVDLNTSSALLKTFSAKVNPGAGDNWLVLNERGTSVTSLPIAGGLTLSLNRDVIHTMPTGEYTGQAVVFNPANQSDLVIVDVSLFVNPGKTTIAPDSGSGNRQTFTVDFPHPGGWEKWSVLNVLFGSGLELAHSCYLAYETAISTLHLTDDQGNLQGAAGEITAGKSAKNGQCGVTLVSAKGDGDRLKLTLDIAFQPSFAGKKNIYLAARDKDQNNSGWLAAGTWEIRPAAPPRKKAAPAKKK